jgi:hypothetical protein
MLIQINITIPPEGSAGPFDLYSDADGYAVPFETQVPAASLVAGYIVELPMGATIIRVCSVGTCENCIDIPTNCPTTTTTSTSSTTTTTSTSSTTTTTTTAAPPYRLNYELITNTPSDIGTVNLIIEVDSVQVVNQTISVGNTYQAGTLNLTAGQVVIATMTSTKTGTFNFGNKIVQDGFLYQPQDNCSPCVDQLVTPFFSPYTMGSANTTFVFQGDVRPPTTTTTSTSSTTTTTSSTTTTTTTATPLDCALNGGTAVFNPPVTTTTTTTSLLARGIITSLSNPMDGCNLGTPDQVVWFSNTTGSFGSEVPTTGGSVVYTNPTGATRFNGDGNNYKMRVEQGPFVGAEVSINGLVESPISFCSPPP